MKISRWLSATFRRLSSRERAVVGAGAAVAATALVALFGVLPLAERAVEREERIAAKAEQRARLQALVDEAPRIRDALAVLRRDRGTRSARLLTGTTRALAASDLQLLVRRYADQSRVVVNRVDVVSETGADEEGVFPIPVRLTGSADVSGLVDLLFYLQHGEKLLVIDEVRVAAGAPRGDGAQVMTWTVRLHGYYAPGDAS